MKGKMVNMEKKRNCSVQKEDDVSAEREAGGKCISGRHFYVYVYTVNRKNMFFSLKRPILFRLLVCIEIKPT